MFTLLMHIVLLPLACRALTEVKTKAGPIIGSRSSSGVSSFWGIPYAEAPTHKLRFRPPMAKRPWSKPLDASQPPRTTTQDGRTAVDFACPQLEFNAATGNTQGRMRGSEDCLKLHVYAPDVTTSESPLPVMVWIHGGGWIVGDAWEKGLYNGTAFVLRANVVLVSIQYRLGILGFLADERLRGRTDGSTTGNWGLLDQQLALKWVKKHISAFGGDPDLVTIFGESAGGESVCFHLVAEGSAGLFDRAIMESGSCDASGDWKDVEVRQTWWKENDPTVCNTTVSSDDYLSCLQGRASVEVLGSLAMMTQMYSAGPTVDRSPGGLRDWPRNLMMKGMVSNKVPVIFGENGNPFQFDCKAGENLKMCGFINLLPVKALTDSEIRSLIESGWGPRWTRLSDDQWSAIQSAYPLDDYEGDRAARLSAMVSDALNTKTSLNLGQCGMLRSLGTYLAAAGTKGYAFDFKRLGSRKLVGHGDEIPYVFQCPGHGDTSDSAEFFQPDASDVAVAQRIADYWGHFARHGEPGADWLPYMEESKMVASISQEDGFTFRFAPPAREHLCILWASLHLPDLTLDSLDASIGGSLFLQNHRFLVPQMIVTPTTAMATGLVTTSLLFACSFACRFRALRYDSYQNLM
eukprot:TRINITY_DN26882_c0_g1_i1.p1 TRINITY_DN26882_c0_g1~~TRINITY_DN26882_c0_g1_i1.p1  ORF type:complete len:633 (+),score=52.67 TRINITY_DN26882_c0_g1_i1:67-1965(+)